MNLNSKEIINYLNLTPHPEGGYFKETYRSRESIINSDLWDGAKGTRNYSTAIYFMLEGQQYSAFHKIKQDEIWHFYAGEAILIHMINNKGIYQIHRQVKSILKDAHLHLFIQKTILKILKIHHPMNVILLI